MPTRIEISYKIPDARAQKLLGFFNSLGLKSKIKKVEVVDVYSIDKKMNRGDVEKAAKLLISPLTQKYSVLSTQSSVKNNFEFSLKINFLPGVTDNVGSTAKETIEDGLKALSRSNDRRSFGTGIKFKNGENVYSSRVYYIYGKVKEDDIAKIAGSIHNPLIQKAEIKTLKQYKKDKGFSANIPKVQLKTKPNVSYVNLYVEDSELEKIGKFGILENPSKNEIASSNISVGTKQSQKDRHASLAISEKRRGSLALSVKQLKVIRDYFHKKGRQPTDVELESLAQTWSEHCKHTIFADPLDEIKDGIYRHYIKRATNIIRARRGQSLQKKKGLSSAGDFCVSVFSDNSGGIIFDKDHLITHKVETHNTPSSLDPFGGAITGIVGVNRDCLGFGLGAKPIINTYGFCLADPKDKTELFRDEKLQNKMLSARRIFEGVVAGINSGGNQSGIPTNDGFVYFDERFRGKPLVFAGTVGLIPRKIKNRESHIKYSKPGDLIVTLGGKVGIDGIHGATFSSEGLSQHSPATAVQIGDPITQKKFSDAIIREARDQQLYSSITDCGAGGLSSAVGEMAKDTGGCEVTLHKVPVKYPGISPWQIWISESQERMVLAIPPSKWKKFEKLIAKRGVTATIIGKFTNSGKCILKYKNKTVFDIDMDFFHNGRPVNSQISSSPQRSEPIYRQPKRPINGHAVNLKSLILNLLKRPNITSYSFISSQYDHEVLGGSVTKPLQGKGKVNSEATVTRPILTSKKGVVLSHGLYPSYSDIDTYHMATASIDSAVRASICAGANLNHLAILDNFCWYSGNEPESLYKLKQAAKACFDIATAYNTPFISGKDSMYNDFKGFNKQGNPIKISIPPTLLISAISVMQDISKAITIDAKIPGDYIYIVGETKNELGGSEYERMMFDSIPSHSPSSSVIPETTRGYPESSSWILKQVQDDRQFSNVPKVDARTNLQTYQAIQKAIEEELIASAISISRGGLAVSLFKTLIAGQLGATLDLVECNAPVQCNKCNGSVCAQRGIQRNKCSEPIHRQRKKPINGHATNPNAKCCTLKANPKFQCNKCSEPIYRQKNNPINRRTTNTFIQTILFSESQGRILITVDPKKTKKFQKLMKGINITKVGQITKDKNISIKNRKKEITNIKLSEATKAYNSTFKNY